MDNLRVIATLVIVASIALLSVFQMQLRGYSKIGRIEEWVLYVDEPETCIQTLELLYSDETNDYYLPCIISDSYIVKSGFEEQSLTYVLTEGLLTIEEIDEIIELTIIQK